MRCRIRPIQITDGNEIDRLYQQSAAYLRALGDTTFFQFSREVYERDGFGPSPAFAGIVAETSEHLLGYLLYTFGYDTDRASRYLMVIDLLVDETTRGQGIGQALMQAAMHICEQHGGQELFWAVYQPNTAAIAFYEGLGAQRVQDLVFMTLALSQENQAKSHQ
jgi:ribosomal protein S18 acetylase RimI-like enzyme